MSADRPKNYTTNIRARQTANECVDLLADAGADHVALAMIGKQPAGLSFRLNTPYGPRDFRLPVNTEGMHKRLIVARDCGEFDSLHTTTAKLDRYTSAEHAADVAWRVARDWLAATVALVQAEMTTMSEAFSGQRVLDDGRTVAEAIRERDAVPELEGTNR